MGIMRTAAKLISEGLQNLPFANLQHVNCASQTGRGFRGLFKTRSVAMQRSLIGFSPLIRVYILFIMSYRSYEDY